jgi:hypothetical protein
MKGVFVGSGSDGMQSPAVCEAVLSLVPTKNDVSTGVSSGAGAGAGVNVLYLGTATYDLPGPERNQTKAFAAAGCAVTALRVALPGKKGFSCLRAHRCHRPTYF